MKLFKIRHPSVPYRIQVPSIQAIPSPKRVVLPLQSPWGTARVLVAKGERVERGQCIAEGKDAFTLPVLSSISGTVFDIRPWPSSQGNEVLSVGIESDGREDSSAETASDDIAARDPLQILTEIAEAGIREVDPHHWPLAFRIASPELVTKIAPSPPRPLTRPVETLILNGLDREPGVFTRGSVLAEREADLLEAISVLRKVSSAQRVVLAVSLDQHLSPFLQLRTKELGVEVVRCPPKYPLALEPLITQFITKREVPQPVNDTRLVGAAVVDVPTALNMLHALGGSTAPADVTLQISGPKEWPVRMVSVRKGMLLEDLLGEMPPLPQKPAKIIAGGLFLGYAQHSLVVPITEEVYSIVVQSREALTRSINEPCSNCGYCVRHCPMHLLPNELGKFIEYGRFEDAESNYLLHCIECGICSYVCPSRRPLIHMVRFGKQEIFQMRKAS